MVNEEVILRKIKRLQEYVNALRQAKDITWEKYRNNIRDRAFVERYVHIAIQSVFDISNHIISYEGWKEPDTYREIFAILASHGVLPEDRVYDFQNMASFRNMLVHHYEKIEDELVFGIFKNKLGDFDLFQKMVLEYINKEQR
ncbi:MAG: DUF86 domain-containing protein [Deltaproteobacteria bacterium]|nr:DUF86 domain-containing protein [Deltaproteobacteria bacterium]